MPTADERQSEGDPTPEQPIDELDVVEIDAALVEEEVDEIETVELSPESAEPTDEAVAIDIGRDEIETELDGLDVWTIKRHPDADAAAQDYLSDLLNGMVEVNLTSCMLRRDQPLPYFGFLSQKPIGFTFDALIMSVGFLIAVPEEELRWGAEGVIKAVSGSDGLLVDLMFGVEVGPRLQWVRFTRELETRVFRKAK